MGNSRERIRLIVPILGWLGIWWLLVVWIGIGALGGREGYHPVVAPYLETETSSDPIPIPPAPSPTPPAKPIPPAPEPAPKPTPIPPADPR